MPTTTSRDQFTVHRRSVIHVCLCLAMIVCYGHRAFGDESSTPLAGEQYHTEVLGEPVDVPPRDRRNVTAINFGVLWIPNGPSYLEVLPFGSLYLWRNWDNDHHRLRATVAGVVNDVNYNIGSRSMKGWEFVFTLDNTIIPLGRSEYVQGQRISAVELQWSYIFAGVGIGYRERLLGKSQDNALEVTLTYEPGYRWFERSRDTSSNFTVPSDTYEGRGHFRLRLDALDRNLMELPHQGYSFGGDAIYGHRAHWSQWGGVAFPSPDAHKEQHYMLASAYVVAAGGVPFVASERHRLIASLYGGIGKNLDRFSAFRLPGRPTGYEWEALSLPVMPGVAFNELFPTRYGIADMIYRYEALFFLYPYVRATYGIVERPRFGPDGSIRFQMDSLPALGGGVISGAPWRSQVELGYSYNFGIFRDPGGHVSMGGHGFFAMWSKEI
jgi:hypothetical protein